MSIRTALFWIAIYAAIIWFLMPATASWYWGRYSLIRFDPQISKDYNCIFVEGHSAKNFTVPWLSSSTPVEYLRIRYTPIDDKQEYGIMFIDPRTLAYEAHNHCPAAPVNLGSRLNSPQPILDWIRSQPHSVLAASHTNDAVEIFNAISSLASCDLEHFVLQTNFATPNLVIGFQSLARRDGPSVSTVVPLLLFCLPLVNSIIRARQSANAVKDLTPSNSRP